jgi:hypothetical protein
LTVKASLIFEKQFTIVNTVNRFPKLNSCSLHAYLISNCRNPAMVGRQNLGGAGIRQHPATVTGCRRTKFRPWSEGWSNLAKMTEIWADLTRSSQNGRDPAKHARRNPAMATELCRIPAAIAFSPFVIFSCVPNAGKYFRKNHFF